MNSFSFGSAKRSDLELGPELGQQQAAGDSDAADALEQALVPAGAGMDGLELAVLEIGRLGRLSMRFHLSG